MSVTIADYAAVQEQVIKIKIENDELREQLESSRRRESMTSAQLIEEIKGKIVELKVSKSQLLREKQQTIERIKLAQLQEYLETKNLLEESEIPAVKSLPDQLKGIAGEVMQLVSEYNEQIARKVFFDSQASDLSRKTKSLEKNGEQLQEVILKLREKQKIETEEVSQRNSELQRLESETRRLRELISAATTSFATKPTPENLSYLKQRVEAVENSIAEKKKKHEAYAATINSRIEGYNRSLDDFAVMKKVIPKKNRMKIKALQDEINKRRGVLVCTNGNESVDSGKMLRRSNQLIDGLAEKQQENWDLEERVAFTRNSAIKMANEITKMMFKDSSDPKAEGQYKKAQGYILRIADIERILRKKRAKKNKK